MKAARMKDEADAQQHSLHPSAFRLHPSSFLWRYGPLVAWTCFVLFASTSSFSASNTSLIIRPLLLWLFPGISEARIDEVHFFIRKTAHFTEYAVLALLAARAFRSSSPRRLSGKWWLASLALVAAVSLLDEYHHAFLAPRTGPIHGTPLDLPGGASSAAS